MQFTVKQVLPALAVAIALQLSFSTVVQADLIGYWPFDELVDGITPDTSPDGGHDGVVSDTFELFDDPVRGSVANFGEFSNNAVVELPTFPQNEDAEAGVDETRGPGFNAIVESQEVTISYWLNRNGDDSTSQWSFLFDAGTGGSNRQLGTHAPWGDGNLYFDVSGCCGGNQRISTSMGDAATDGEWHHLAYVKRKDEGQDLSVTAVYLDGQILVSSAGWNGDADPTITDVIPIIGAAIGAQKGGGNSQNGLMDDFAIWNEALEPDRIISLSEGGGVIPLPEGATLGDFNSDGNIDFSDFLVIANNLNSKFSVDDAFANGDMDGNLRITLKDFLKFRELFESLGAAGEPSAVPEPAAGLLMSLAALGLLTFRRRR